MSKQEWIEVSVPLSASILTSIELYEEATVDREAGRDRVADSKETIAQALADEAERADDGDDVTATSLRALGERNGEIRVNRIA